MGLIEISGYQRNLKNGFEKLGYSCTAVDIKPSPFQYGQNLNNFYIRFLRRLVGLTRDLSLTKSIWHKPLGIVQDICRLPLFIWALFRFQIFIFSFRSSFFFFCFEYFELPLLKLFGKKIIHVFLGSDSRPPYIDGYNIRNDDPDLLNRLKHETNRTFRSVRTIEKYADFIVTSPARAQFHTQSFISWHCIGFPFPMPAKLEPKPTKNNAAVRILHAPSRPIAKGSSRIQTMIENLQKKYDIEYLFITGQPNKTVIEALQSCDIVIDEVFSDAPIGGISSEAASFGIPTVIGSYYVDHIFSDIPEEFRPPILVCHPDQMETKLKELIQTPTLRQQVGHEAYHFVHRNFSPETVASRFIALLNGTYPEDWVFNIKNVNYLEGYGLSALDLNDRLKQFKETWGISEFQLKDKPELETALLQKIKS